MPFLEDLNNFIEQWEGSIMEEAREIAADDATHGINPPRTVTEIAEAREILFEADSKSIRYMEEDLVDFIFSRRDEIKGKQ